MSARDPSLRRVSKPRRFSSPLQTIGIWLVGFCCGLYIIHDRNAHAFLRQRDSPQPLIDNVEMQENDGQLSSIVTRSNPAKRDGDGCYHVFIDAGANIGVHGRFLFEPHKYPNSRRARSLFDREFGETRDNRDFCVFEIEPNPNHHQTLQEKADAYKAMGWRYHILPVGASDREGTLDFVHQGDENKKEWGFSVKNLGQTKRTETVKIPVIRLASWIEEHVNKRQIPSKTFGNYSDKDVGGPKVVMKIDIEGSEYVVMPDLMLTGALCGIDFIFGEFHPGFAPLDFPGQRVPVQTRPELRGFGNAILTMVKASRNCKTRFEPGDDESHLHDGIPLPTPTKEDSSAN